MRINLWRYTGLAKINFLRQLRLSKVIVSQTDRQTDSTEIIYHSASPVVKKPFVKPLEFGQWSCRKPPAGLLWAAPSGRAVCRCRIHSEAGTGSSCSAMTQYYPTTSAAAAVWASGPSFPVSAMLLIYTYSLLLARALSETLLFVLCLLQTPYKERWKF